MRARILQANHYPSAVNNNRRMTARSLLKASSALRLILVIAIAATLYGLVPQLGGLHASLYLLRAARREPLMLAGIAYLATFASATLLYKILALRKLFFIPTLIVQLAAMGANRLLPAGSGALVTNVAYLRRSRHTLSEAGTIVSLNNTLGVVGHVLLLIIMLPLIAPVIQMPRWSYRHILVGIIIGAVLIILGVFLRRYKNVQRARLDIVRTLEHYRRRPLRLGWALICSMSLTALNVACLWYCGQALDLHFSPAGALVALTAGVGAGTVIPTPGGLGAAEAGLYAALVIQHVSPAGALATALLFRLITFWLPAIIGMPAWLYVKQQKML